MTSFARESQPVSGNIVNCLTNEENKQAMITTGGNRADQPSASFRRRISYSFERPGDLMCNVDLDQVKKTIRKHIRSPPQVSAEAMPEFIKVFLGWFLLRGYETGDQHRTNYKI